MKYLAVILLIAITGCDDASKCHIAGKLTASKENGEVFSYPSIEVIVCNDGILRVRRKVPLKD